ncbi:MAG: S-layer protein [Methanoregulaceae archaeon]|nr:S-layer protein [Methanoregulaceae archaeon]
MIVVPRYVILAGIAIALLVILPVSAEPTVTISDFKVTPQVLMPGDLGTITVTLKNTASSASLTERTGALSPENSGTTTVTDINVFIEKALLEGNGIGVIGDSYQRIGDLGPGQTIDITFLIQAPAKTGLYFPEVWIDTKGGRSTRYPVPVNVNTPIAVAKVAVIGTAVTTPDAVKPGEQAAVRLDLINSGESSADRVIVRIGNASTSVKPRDAELYHVPSIPAGQHEPIEITFITDRKAEPGIATVPVTITYYTTDGAEHTEHATINLMVWGDVDIGIASIETSPERIISGEPFNLIIRIENAGTGDAKSVNAKIDLPLSGNREAFLGKIKPGNDAPALFRLGSAPAGDHPYTVTITYNDEWGNHTVTQPLSLSVAPADYSGIIIAVIVLVLLAAGAWWVFIRKTPVKNHE